MNKSRRDDFFGGSIEKDKYYALEQDGEGYQYVKLYAVTWKVK